MQQCLAEISHGALNEALHWNGRKWSSVKVPQPGGAARDAVNALLGVRCGRSGTCWAVGFYFKGSLGHARVLIAQFRTVTRSTLAQPTKARILTALSGIT